MAKTFGPIGEIRVKALKKKDPERSLPADRQVQPDPKLPITIQQNSFAVFLLHYILSIGSKPAFINSSSPFLNRSL
ncbi:hypothetical protein [Flagellimonas nanhaiensis]|uniref:hypothetical protein n=1 Tax=Flagellimonas nanhaiensis TaxID=2292706 RepID=UPI0011C06B43|nr:hypothetical protein [Allomuricauda nanhaiensis]